jgi:hypothetical protein
MTRTLQLCLAFTAAALAGVLSGCSGSSDDTDQSQNTQDTAGQMPRFPGAFGEIADVSGTTLQVRDVQSGEVKVTYTDSTEFTQQVNGSIADLAVGDCVMVASDSATDADSVTATAVTVSAAVDGSCQGGMNPGEIPSGLPSDIPNSGIPSGAPPSGATPPSGGGMPGGTPGGGGVFGPVTAVTETGFTVESTVPGGESGEPRSVTVSDTTTWMITEAATASALTVGRCVNATGETDDAGTVTATRITVSDPVDGECTGGFGPAGRP